ncbi:MAG TPA: PAS domain S-box protein [Chloroflexota bacterium]|nr:PAS domain S-box protein [Chloroflexota bacterium]
MASPASSSIGSSGSATAAHRSETPVAGLASGTHLTPEDLGIGTLFWAVRDAVVVTNATTGTVVLWNPAAERIFGYSAAEAVGMPVIALVPEWRRKEIATGLSEYATTGHSQLTDETAPRQSVVVRKDGQEIIVESSVSPLDPAVHPDLPGRFLLAITRDVTERVRSEEAIRRLSRQNELFLTATAEGIFGLDLEGKVNFINPAAALMTGREPAEMAGKPEHDLIHHSRHDGTPYPKEECPMLASLRDGRVRYSDDEVFWRGDGTSFPVEYTCAPVQADGVIEGVVVTFRDISERRQAQEALERRTQELQQSNSDLEQFAYVASHDLQEPLRTVVSYLQLVEEDYREQLGIEGKEFLDFAVDGAKRMQTLINDLLVYSRVGRLGRAFESVSVEAVLGEVLSDLRSRIREVGATITYDPLPTVYADVVQLAQLLQNLLSNAMKFADEAPPRIHVSAVPDPETEKMWRFAVRDNGIGISPEYQELIFVIFQRLHLRDEYPGTGIGLAVCKKIVERHGGRVWVESAAGEGATFYFTLPAAEDQSVGEGPHAA